MVFDHSQNYCGQIIIYCTTKQQNVRIFVLFLIGPPLVLSKEFLLQWALISYIKKGRMGKKPFPVLFLGNMPSPQIQFAHKNTKNKWKLATIFINIGFSADKFVISSAKSGVRCSWKLWKPRGFFSKHIKRWRLPSATCAWV